MQMKILLALIILAVLSGCVVPGEVYYRYNSRPSYYETSYTVMPYYTPNIIRPCYRNRHSW